MSEQRDYPQLARIGRALDKLEPAPAHEMAEALYQFIEPLGANAELVPSARETLGAGLHVGLLKLEMQHLETARDVALEEVGHGLIPWRQYDAAPPSLSIEPDTVFGEPSLGRCVREWLDPGSDRTLVEREVIGLLAGPQAVAIAHGRTTVASHHDAECIRLLHRLGMDDSEAANWRLALTWTARRLCVRWWSDIERVARELCRRKRLTPDDFLAVVAAESGEGV